jgi:hypothetical protein
MQLNILDLTIGSASADTWLTVAKQLMSGLAPLSALFLVDKVLNGITKKQGHTQLRLVDGSYKNPTCPALHSPSP